LVHESRAPTTLHLIDAVDGDIASVTADGVYDSIAIYDADGARGATVVVPPTNTFTGVSAPPAVDCSRSHDHEGEGDRTASVEKGVWLPSAGARGERILPVQVDHRGRPSSAQSGRAED